MAGDVRELEHLNGRSALKALAANRERRRILTLTAADLALSNAPPRKKATPEGAQAVSKDFRSAVTEFERNMVLDTLTHNNQNWAAVARELDLDRANLNRVAKRLGLK